MLLTWSDLSYTSTFSILYSWYIAIIFCLHTTTILLSKVAIFWVVWHYKTCSSNFTKIWNCTIAIYSVYHKSVLRALLMFCVSIFICTSPLFCTLSIIDYYILINNLKVFLISYTWSWTDPGLDPKMDLGPVSESGLNSWLNPWLNFWFHLKHHSELELD